jgi:hypothetical protein
VRIAREATYSFNGGDERRSSDVAEMQRVVQQLTAPKTSVVTNLDGWDGYLDFFVLDDGRIQMEIMEDDDHFATVDAPTVARVIEIAMTDTSRLPLRQKLSELPIDWLT